MNTNSEEDWKDYRIARHRLKVSIKKSSDKSWKQYTSSIETESETSRLKKVLSNDSRIRLGTLKKADGTYTISEKEQFELLLQTHFPQCHINDDNGWEAETIYQPDTTDWAFADSIVTEEATAWAVNSFKPHKAAGNDEIFPALLQWGLQKIKPYLMSVFRASLACKYIPKAWREVKVVFLPKPGKTDYTNPKSFRPISLSSFLLKTLERLCDKYVRNGPLTENPVHKNQHAYQSGKSTETALHQVVHKIETALESKQSCLVTFIDIEGAFDKTAFPSIEKGLEKQGIDNRMTGWVTNMLSNRAASVGTSDPTRCIVTRGCPQGGVMSPLLWIVVVNELIQLLNKEGITTIGYADDLAIMVTGLFETTMCEKMQTTLKTVERWCEQHSLSVNPQKTELVLFTRKTKIPVLTLPKFFGSRLTLSKEVKYLGIWLDSKLLWGKQLDHITDKAINILWQSTRAVGKDWGLKPKLCRWLYTVIVRPILTYGCVVWWPRTNLVTTINKLQHVQRLACSLISGCSKTTPSAALNIILGLTPLHLHIQQEAMASALRIKSTGQWKGSSPTTNHCKIANKAIEIIPEATNGTDKIANTHLDNKKYELITEEETSKQTVEPSIIIRTTYRIYTDGAKNKDGTGCGFYSQDLNLLSSHALNKTTTTMQAEAMGLLLAAKAIVPEDMVSTNTVQIKENQEIKVIEFFTDNAATIYALRRPTTRSRIIAECHKTLQNLTNYFSVKVVWIKSHSSCQGNNKADKLAKEGCKKNVNDEVIQFCKPTTLEVRDLLSQYTEKEHQKLWEKRKDCTHTKRAFPVLNKNTTNTLLKLQRQDLRLLISLITGHCNLNYHLHKTGATDSPLCRACMQEDETVEHVLTKCAVTKEIRAKHGLHEAEIEFEQTVTPSPLEQLSQRPKTALRYFKELGWLG